VVGVGSIAGTDDLFLKGNPSETKTVYLGGDQLRFYTQNLERMTIVGSGYIGINHNTPSRPLHIKATSDRNIRLEEDGGGAQYFDIGVDNNGNLDFWSGIGTMALTIEYSSGDVGIGVSSPQQKLDVDGNIRVRDIKDCVKLGTNSNGTLYCNDSCLEQGTLILTPEGLKKIEELNSGDHVIGYKDGKEVEAQITETFVHDGEWTLYNYQGSWFTGDHRVSTDFENFVEVSELTDITKQYTGKVYNLEVAWTENYFGEDNLLIHNK